MVDLAFLIPTYQDTEDLLLAVRSIRAVYPLVPIVLMGDGPQPVEARMIALVYGCEYTELSERSKVRRMGGLWIAQLLILGLETGAQTLIRFDTDSRVHRPFSLPLPSADLFGNITLQTCYGQPRAFIQAGVSGYQASAAQRLVASGLLAEAKYQGRTFGQDREDHSGDCQLREEFVLWDCALRLGLSLAHWGDVASLTRGPIIEGDWAASHPHQASTAVSSLTLA